MRRTRASSPRAASDEIGEPAWRRTPVSFSRQRTAKRARDTRSRPDLGIFFRLSRWCHSGREPSCGLGQETLREHVRLSDFLAIPAAIRLRISNVADFLEVSCLAQTVLNACGSSVFVNRGNGPRTH